MGGKSVLGISRTSRHEPPDPLFVAYPELAQEISRVCELPPWQMTGVSALAVWEGCLVLELTKPKHWRQNEDGVTMVGLGAIGGSLEPGETLLACLQREASEELGAPLEVLSSQSTVIVYERKRISRLSPLQRGQPLPVLMTVSENLFRPELGPAARTLAIATFWGRLGQAPRLGDLWGMLYAPLEQVAAMLRGLPCAPEELAAIPGVRMTSGAPLPPRARLEPVWTVHSLWRTLQEGPLPESIPPGMQKRAAG